MAQQRKADEIIIADDGSRDDTAQLIERYKELLPIRHVWHEDKGFRKTTILNEALHLDHGRPYENKEAWDLNNKIRRETRQTHRTRTDYGISKS